MWRAELRKWNRNWATGLIGVVLLTLMACSDLPESDSSGNVPEPGVPKQLRSRQIIVALAEKERPQWPAIVQDLQTRYRLRPVGEFPLASIGVQCLVFQVPADQPLESVITSLQTDPRVELVQANQVFDALQTAPDDHYSSYAPYAGLVYGIRLLEAHRAQRISTGRGVTVAVIDTGADTGHPDLRSRGVRMANFVEGGEQSFSLDRHGTAVAGIIGAHPNGVGLEGVAPDTLLSVVKACWYSDPTSAKALCSSWTLAKAVDFAINGGAKVINLSLNGRPDPLLGRLVAAAHRRGIVLVAAAAEDRDDPGFPAAVNAVIPVISCDVNRTVSLPRWRSATFVAVAPGQDIVAPAPRDRYALLSGSSLAAAHVTGVVALLLQRQPDLSPDRVKTLLQTSARSVSTARAELGVVDACAVLKLAAPELACP